LEVIFAARPATPERTFGYYRLEILAAVVNEAVIRAFLPPHSRND
jgi:cobalt-zinc-cadmium efflux system protein